MSARLPAIVCAVAIAILIGACPPRVRAQAAGASSGGKAAADTAAADTEAAEAIAAMAKAVEARDAAGVQAQLRRYEELWRRVSPKLLKKISISIVAMFKAFKPRDDYDIPLEPQRVGDAPKVVENTARQEMFETYRLAAGVLYDKPEGREIIQSVLKITHVRAWPEVVATMVEGLGYQPDAGLTAVIKPYLDDPSPQICGAAAKALSQLHDQPLEVRREAVAALVKAYTAAQVAADKERRRSSGPQDEDGEAAPEPASERLALMDVPFGQTLQRLTRQSFPDPKGWQDWFDKHGKESTW